MESLLTEAIVSTMVALVGPKHEMMMCQLRRRQVEFMMFSRWLADLVSMHQHLSNIDTTVCVANIYVVWLPVVAK